MGDARTCIDELLEVSQKGMSFPYEVEKSGIKISVFKNVFSPFFFGDSEYFADNLFSIPGLNVKEKNILEIGTGTGLIALKFAFEWANKVVATDISQDAVDNARFNVEQHNLQTKIDVRKWDLFQPVAINETFDIIFRNIPFEFSNAGEITELERSVYSVDYENFRRYLEGGFNYLTSNGRLLLGFSPTVGECEMLDDIVKELCLSKTVLQEGRYEFAWVQETVQVLEFAR